MITFVKNIFSYIVGSLKDLLPIIIVISFFQLVVLQQTIPNLPDILLGSFFVVIGLAFFIYGLDLALFPIGETLAFALAKKGSVFWLVLFSFVLGFGTTIAEPALIAIANKAAKIAIEANMVSSVNTVDYANGIRYAIAVSVGFAIVIGVLRILLNWSLPLLIIGGYISVIVLTFFAPKYIIGIAYDSGGVTTSTITVPLITALGIGLASTIKGRNPLTDGFGLVAFAALMPINSVMLYGIFTSV